MAKKSKKTKEVKEVVIEDTQEVVIEDTQEVVKETHTPIKLVGVQTVVGSKLGTLTEGKEYTVTAELAEILINKGFAYLKNK